jgi:excisionase family DNA binding protein
MADPRSAVTADLPNRRGQPVTSRRSWARRREEGSRGHPRLSSHASQAYPGATGHSKSKNASFTSVHQLSTAKRYHSMLRICNDPRTRDLVTDPEEEQMVRTDNRPRTVEQAAEELSLSEATIRSWISQRRLAHFRLGRAIRIPAEEIQRVLQTGFVPAIRKN